MYIYGTSYLTYTNILQQYFAVYSIFYKCSSVFLSTRLHECAVAMESQRTVIIWQHISNDQSKTIRYRNRCRNANTPPRFCLVLTYLSRYSIRCTPRGLASLSLYAAAYKLYYLSPKSIIILMT